jgi:hypothetical protein
VSQNRRETNASAPLPGLFPKMIYNVRQCTGKPPFSASARCAPFFRTSRRASLTPCETRERPRGNGSAHCSLLSCPQTFRQNHPPIQRQPTITKISEKHHATAHQSLNSLPFLAQAPAGQFLRRRKNANQTNHMHPDRRRCFYLAVKNLRNFPRRFPSILRPTGARSLPNSPTRMVSDGHRHCGG